MLNVMCAAINFLANKFFIFTIRCGEYDDECDVSVNGGCGDEEQFLVYLDALIVVIMVVVLLLLLLLLLLLFAVVKIISFYSQNQTTITIVVRESTVVQRMDLVGHTWPN